MNTSTLKEPHTGVGPVRAVGFVGDADRGLHPRLFNVNPFRVENRPVPDIFALRILPKLWGMLSAARGGASGGSLFRLTKASHVCILGKEGQALRLRAVRMASWNVSQLRSMCRFRHTSNEQKDPLEEVSSSKTLKYEGRSGDMYENKGLHDKLPVSKRTFLHS